MGNFHKRRGIKPKPFTPPKPVTKFGRPRGESFTVSFTGDSNFPEVYVSAEAHGKMLALVKECSIEISWMCSVTRRENGDFDINDVYVPLQSCGPADTEISEDGDEALMMELFAAGKGSEVDKLRCWGHSHVNMAVFASNTDEIQTQSFIDNLTNAGSDHFVRFIGNKRGELLCHVYLLDKGVILNNPDMTVRVNSVDYSEWAKAEIAEKVTQQAFIPRSPYGYGANMGADPTIPSNAIGFWMGDQFIVDDLKEEPLDYTPLTAQEADEYAEFFDLKEPSEEELDDPYYDFANRGQ